MASLIAHQVATMRLSIPYPADFFFTIPWPVHFDWVAAPGRNFLIQVTEFGNSNGNAIWGYPLDATSGTGRLYGTPASATTGTLEPNYGLVLGLRALTHTAVPHLFSTNTPMIGDTFRVRIEQARPLAPAVLCLGGSRTQWLGVPLPIDLAWLGAAGCSVLASVDVTSGVTIGAGGTASFTYSLPNTIYLLNGHFYNQFVVLDQAANGLGLAFSNAGAGVIGNQ